MITKTKTAKSFAFSLVVLLPLFAFAQVGSAQFIEITGFHPKTESEEASVAEDETDQPLPGEWVRESKPIVHESNSIENYSTFKTSDTHSTFETFDNQSTIETFDSHSNIETFDGHHPKFSVASLPELATSQQLTESDLIAQAFGVGAACSPNHIFLKDVGYEGPGDMRYHLWKDHASDLQSSGISREALTSMSQESVQKWHNYFHGTEDAPDDH